jgi:hypothetical protein
MSTIHHKRTSCRACGDNRLRGFLSLGPMPLANSFLQSRDQFIDEPVFPLDVCFCETCSLVQLFDVIDPKILFRNYIYVTGTSDTMAAHNVRYASTLVEILKLRPEDLVVEVASNDGSLLKCFQSNHVRTLGIEPAVNIAEIASAQGIATLNQFFNSSTAQQIRASHGPAKVIIANNVLAHVDNTQDFLCGAKELLHEDGLVVIEVPYLRQLIDRLEYDTIYHEHLCYFSVAALMRLCDAVGLSIARIDHVPVHGGSLRMYAGLPAKYPNHHQDVLSLIADERRAGLTTFSRYEHFAVEVEANRRAVRAMLQSLKDKGKTVAAYGAPAKGNTLLNYCRIDTQLVPFTVDKSAMKVGLYTPGMHIPVFPLSALLERQPEYVLILAWNFAEEIMAQQHNYRIRGGRFVIPIPEPKVV